MALNETETADLLRFVDREMARLWLLEGKGRKALRKHVPLLAARIPASLKARTLGDVLEALIRLIRTEEL